jgi:acyl carrier protein
MGEIETTLSKFSGIESVVINVITDPNNTKHLAAYYVAKSPIETQDLEAFCRQYLPQYMIPSYFVSIATIPLSVNGKIDKKALPHPEQALRLEEASEKMLPQTKTEQIVAEVWQHFLNREIIYQDDNFFTLGGHSLIASQMIAVLNEKMGVKINLKKIFTSPTLQKIAAEIDAIAWVNRSNQNQLYSESSNEILI